MGFDSSNYNIYYVSELIAKRGNKMGETGREDRRGEGRGGGRDDFDRIPAPLFSQSKNLFNSSIATLGSPYLIHYQIISLD